MKPILTETKQIHYVTEAEMIEFIHVNSGMPWNDCCDYIREQGISGEEGTIFWSKSTLAKPSTFRKDQFKWINGFFEAHPWIEDFIIVLLVKICLNQKFLMIQVQLKTY